MKGVNLYMFVERDNWLQCPLDERGGKRSSYEVISGIYGALRRNKWHELDMVRDLGVFKNTAYHLYADGSDDGIFDPGYPDDYLRDGLYGGHAAKQQFVATFRALHDASIDFEVFKDTRNGETIRDFKCILVYSLWFMDRRAANDLLEFVENGGALILFPCVPTHGEDGKELDVFTDKLGLEPSGDTQIYKDGIPPRELGIDAVLAATSGDFRTADGKPWAQVRSFGKGKVLTLNAALADAPEALEKIVTQWGNCRKYVETESALTDGGMAMKGDEYAVAAVVNGREDGRVSEVAVDVSKLKSSDTYAVTDELTDSLIGDFEAVDGVVRVPVDLGPRDGMMLKVTTGKSEKSPSKEVEFETTELVQWKARSEDETAYHDIYLGPAIDESWAAVPRAEWTLPALASGKVLGVQGWFYLKQNVKLPEGDGEVYVQVKPNGFHNLGVVYVNGTECGRFMIERPGAASSFDVTDLVRRGEENTLAIRLYRQSLDCHDRGSSGFDVLRFECGSAIVDVHELRLKQEIRDFGEKAGWPDADVSDGEWRAVQVPLEVTMNRGGDALWLLADVEAGACESAYLHIEGNNCVAAVFVNGKYAVKSPMLPCKLPVGEFLKQGVNKIAVRVTPDNFDNYLVPRDKRYESYIQNGLLPLDVKIEKVELRVGK